MTPEFSRPERVDQIHERERVVEIAATPEERAKLAARFDLVAVTWDQGSAPADTSVRVRVRESAGWSAWEQLDPDDAAPDPGSADARAQAASGRGSSEVLLTGGATGVQVRVDGSRAPSRSAPEARALRSRWRSASVMP